MAVPVWFGLDDDGTIVFTTGEKSVKARAISREPRVAFCVDEEAPPYAYVRIDGRAELIDDIKLVRSWATRLGGRYMGMARAQEFGDRNAVPGEVVVRIKPERVVAHADITGPSV
jgi:PPOX class probable F420-dependent enzyme